MRKRIVAVMAGLVMAMSMSAFAIGTGTIDKVSGWYSAGSNLTATATPGANSYFNAWQGQTNGTTITSNQIQFTVTGPRAVTGLFSHIVHNIAASAGANGSISPSGTVGVQQGSNQTFTITPGANYHIADVVVDSVSAGTPGTFTFTNVVAAHTISATFAINQYQVTFNLGTNGTLGSGTLVQMVNHGSAAAAPTVNANTGYTFTGWNSSAYNNVTSNMTITAQYAINKYTVTVVSAYGTPNPSGVTTSDWNTVTSASIANSTVTMGTTQYVATGWIGTGSATNGTGTNTSFTLISNTAITWQWKTNYWIDFSVTGN